MIIMIILTFAAIIVLVVLAICHFFGPQTRSWCSNGEEKIGLSEKKLYNANGYIVHSGSEILLGSTGSFKRFDSVDRNAHEGELIYGQTTLATPPWTTDESIPPQPLRPAPCPMPLTIQLKNKNASHIIVNKQNSLESKAISAPLKSVPRPVPRKQLSAPASSCRIPLINPPEKSLQKMFRNVHTTTNPFLNGLVSFESIKTNFFSSTITTECKFENERETKSAMVSKNPFINSSVEHSVFDFNPTAIKSIMEETPDDGYLGDNDEKDEVDLLKTLEERIQRIELSGKHRRKSSGSGSTPRYSPKILHKPMVSTSSENMELNSNVHEKFVDSPCNDESIAKSFRKHIRNRSFSENEVCDLSIYNENVDYADQMIPLTAEQTASTNPFLNGKRLLKTPSETFLEQYSMLHQNIASTANSDNHNSSQLPKHLSLNKFLQTSPPLFKNIEMPQTLTSIKRALSSESISSESSVVMSSLERTTPPITGLLCVALQYDKHTATLEGCELICTVLEAKNLLMPSDADPGNFVDTFNLLNIEYGTFVRVYLVPDESEAMQTKIFKNSRHPSYQEMFAFFITKQKIKRSLWFHLYHTNASCTTLIGETEMKISEIHKPLTTWLQLSDSRNNCTSWGDLMFSLSYLPTAERLTVVVVKARSLNVQNAYVKVYLLKNDKKVCKKRTSTKRGEQNPVYNEAMIFSVPPFLLNSIQVRLTVSEANDGSQKSQPIGHVIVGSRTDGKGLLHWHQMITSLRKPVAMFHPLRKSATKN